MSGIKVTSVFGSMINVAIFRYIARQADVSYNYMISLGDDLDVQLDDYGGVQRMLRGYKACQF